MNAASYTYAIARQFDPGQVSGLRGVDDAPVHLVHHHDLVAVVSTLPRTDANALRSRLESLEDLETIARAHHAVVEAVAARTVALPLRLATIHHGDTRVADILCRSYAHFRTALDRLADRVELGVKVYIDHKSAGDTTMTRSTDAIGAGRGYLRRRRQERDRRERSWQCATTTVQTIDAALTAAAVDRKCHRPQRAPLLSARGENIFNAAYLVERARARDFARLARGLGAGMAAASIEVTGPWAPYSFAAVGSSAAPADEVQEAGA